MYEFSFGSFLVGILIIMTGAALFKWYRPIADNMASGVSSYERFKLWALITCGIGVLVMFNLHVLILRWLFGMLIPRG